MTFWAIRDKESGRFFDGVLKPFVEVPISKTYRTIGHARSALTLALHDSNNYHRHLNYSGLEVVELRAEVVENDYY